MQSKSKEDNTRRQFGGGRIPAAATVSSRTGVEERKQLETLGENELRVRLSTGSRPGRPGVNDIASLQRVAWSLSRYQQAGSLPGKYVSAPQRVGFGGPL